MAGSTRIKGNKLALQFGSPAEDFWMDVTAVTLTNDEADADVVTFADAAEGGARDYFLNITAIQSTDPTSLWRYTWDHTGDEVGFTYAPHGNETPTAAQPHFVGNVTIGPKPEIGGEAGVNVTQTYETTWTVVGTPVLDTGSGGPGDGE